MKVTTAVRSCLGKYASFSGRASRSEYWKFVLFVLIATGMLGWADLALFGVGVTVSPDAFADGIKVEANGPLSSLFGLTMVLPLAAAGWRRMQDTGRRGIFLFYPMIVMVGVSAFLGFVAGFENILSGDIWLIVGGLGKIVGVGAMIVLVVSPLLVLWWLTRPSQAGDNRFGAAS